MNCQALNKGIMKLGLLGWLIFINIVILILGPLLGWNPWIVSMVTILHFSFWCVILGVIQRG